jgi:hypothetical protein
MEHLSVDEMIRFVSLSSLDDESMEFAETVNRHIRECDECRKKVYSFQLLYDSFEMAGSGGDFQKYIYARMVSSTNEKTIEIKAKRGEDR